MPTRRIDRRRALRWCGGGLAALMAIPYATGSRAGWLDEGLKSLKGLAGDGEGGLSDDRITKGLKQALEVASKTVIRRVGQPGGYLEDQAIHIPLPGYLDRAREGLRLAGAGGLLDDLETRLNRAAETAAPHARSLFVEAIGAMTVDDARRILEGPDDAATRYFQRTMTPDLKETFRPIVDRELEAAGAIQLLDQVGSQLDSIPFAAGLDRNAKGLLVDHGLDGALDGLFHYLAREEAAIRNDPAKRTTELLKEVFGGGS